MSERARLGSMFSNQDSSSQICCNSQTYCLQTCKRELKRGPMSVEMFCFDCMLD